MLKLASAIVLTIAAVASIAAETPSVIAIDQTDAETCSAPGVCPMISAGAMQEIQARYKQIEAMTAAVRALKSENKKLRERKICT